MRFNLLGPVEIRSDGHALDLGRAKERCVLAVLLMHLGEHLTSDRLIDRVWDTAPDGVRSTLRSYMTRVRNAVETDPANSLTASRGGYLLRVPRDAVDVYRHRDLVGGARDARKASDHQKAVSLLREARGLCGGTPLTGVSGIWADTVRNKLERAHRESVIVCLDSELAVGRHAEVVDELSDLVARHTEEERLAALLMLALFRCGRYAQAEECYHQVKEYLDKKFDRKPDAALRNLHARVVRRDPQLRPPRPYLPGAGGPRDGASPGAEDQPDTGQAGQVGQGHAGAARGNIFYGTVSFGGDAVAGDKIIGFRPD